MAQAPAKAQLTDRERAISLAQTGKSYAEIAELLGRDPTTISRWVKSATETERKAVNPDKLEMDHRRILSLEDEIRGLRTQLLSSRRESLTEHRVEQIIMNMAKIPSRDPKPTWMLKPHTMKDFGTPVLFLSDLHWSENVEPSEINGTNEYNIKIARKRLRTCIEKAAGLIVSKPGYTKKQNLILLLGGDMVSGDIHEELVETNDVPSMVAALDLVDDLIWCIKELQGKVCENIHIAGVTGNHGRKEVKPRAKRRVHSSWDWLIYKILQREIISQKLTNITIDIPNGPDAFFNAHGWPCLLTHGDMLGVKGGDGIIGVLGPVVRGDFKVRVQAMGEGRNFRTTFMGHFHTPIVIENRLIVNGSLIGTNEYSRNMLRVPPGPPVQTLAVMHGLGGITCYDKIYVEERMAAYNAYEKAHAFEPALTVD